MHLAPIILFVYNRPEHTEQTLNALAANELAGESALFIYADGPRHKASEFTLENIKKTRQIIKSKRWCKEVFITEREENYGLQRSVITGVTEIVNKYEKVIVLEDDIVTSKYFLPYMNDALNVYQDEQKVLSISSLNFFATDSEVGETFFTPIPDCWGWATWKNRWQLFEPNAQLLLNRLIEKHLVDKFNLNGAFNFESMLIDQIKGDISSWAIRWQAGAYVENKLSLYPKYSTTKNIGFGQGGTHGGADKFTRHIKFAEKKINVRKIPAVEDQAIVEKMANGYWKTTQPEPKQKIRLEIRAFIKSLLPPVLYTVYKKIRPHREKGILWLGNFSDWNEAKNQCSGYDDPLILTKTKNAVLKVKNGEATFERDSVLFGKPEYNWPLITILLKAAAENCNNLGVLDFGGSLGSIYFQNLSILQPLDKLEWSVVEQAHYVTTGNNEIANEELKFYLTIDDCLQKRKPAVLLLSSVLQYLEQPYLWIDRLIRYNFEYIIVDKTLFINEAGERLTIQKVPPSIYPASYPAWFFNSSKFLKAFEASYELFADFDPYTNHVITLEDQVTCYYKGFIFKRKKVKDA